MAAAVADDIAGLLILGAVTAAVTGGEGVEAVAAHVAVAFLVLAVMLIVGWFLVCVSVDEIVKRL